MATKQEIIAKFQLHEGDTGSPEVQIALLTDRINHLNEHLKEHKEGSPLPSRPSDSWSVSAAACSTISRKPI